MMRASKASHSRTSGCQRIGDSRKKKKRPFAAAHATKRNVPIPPVPIRQQSGALSFLGRLSYYGHSEAGHSAVSQIAAFWWVPLTTKPARARTATTPKITVIVRIGDDDSSPVSNSRLVGENSCRWRFPDERNLACAPMGSAKPFREMALNLIKNRNQLRVGLPVAPDHEGIVEQGRSGRRRWRP